MFILQAHYSMVDLTLINVLIIFACCAVVGPFLFWFGFKRLDKNGLLSGKPKQT